MASSNIETLISYEDHFKQILGFYLLLTKNKSIEFITRLNIDSNLNQEIKINCEIINRSSNLVNFTYDLLINGERYTFPEFYFYYYEKIIFSFTQTSYQYYFSVAIMNPIIESIQNHKEIQLYYNSLKDFDQNKKKLFPFEQKILGQMNYLDDWLKFGIKAPLDIHDLYPKSIGLVKDLLEISIQEKTGNWGINLEDYYDMNTLSQSHELFYKGLVSTTLTFFINGKSNIFVNDIKDMYRIEKWDSSFVDIERIFKKTHNPAPEDLNYAMEIGAFLPFYMLDKEKEMFEPLMDLIKEKDSQNGTYLPYTMDKNFMAIDIPPRLKNYILGHKIANSKFDNGLERFIQIYGNDHRFQDILPKIPALFYNGDIIGLLQLELGSISEKRVNSVTLRLFIRNLLKDSEMAGEGIERSLITHHYSINISSDKNLKILINDFEKLYSMMRDLFAFYPFHPFFLNTISFYPILYALSVKGRDFIDHSKKDFIYGNQVFFEKDRDFKSLWNLFTYFRFDKPHTLFDQDETGGFKLTSGLGNVVFEKIVESYKNKLYLIMLMWMEKWFNLLCSVQYTRNKKDRDIDHIINNYRMSLIEGTIKRLEKEYSNNRFNIIFDEPQGDANFDSSMKELSDNHTKTIFPISKGLYIFLKYNKSKETIKIFKLNCVSFNYFELRMIEWILLHDFYDHLNVMAGSVSVETYNIKNQNFKGILIRNIKDEEQYFHYLNAFYGIYDNLLKFNNIDSLHDYENDNQIIGFLGSDFEKLFK